MDPPEYRWPRLILLWLGWICSITCYLLVFVSLGKSPEITRKRLHHHVILALLACNFLLISIELPIALAYSSSGQVPVESDRFCAFWVAFNYGVYVGGVYLMAFDSVERYFLIFHDRFVYRWRFFVHYLPILVCFCYPLGFYGVIVNVYPCDHVYLYDAYVCGGDCFQFETAAGTVDYLIHVVVPIGVIILGNLTLLVRVTLKKRTMKRANTWRKSRLMYIQLLSISILYSLVWIPFVIVSLIRLFHDPFFLQDFTLLILNYCLYLSTGITIHRIDWLTWCTAVHASQSADTYLATLHRCSQSNRTGNIRHRMNTFATTPLLYNQLY